MLAGPCTYGRYVSPLYVRLINCRFHLFRSSASFLSSQFLLLFLKSSRSCALLLPTPFSSVICPSVTSWRRQFLLRIWLILGYYLEVSFSLLYVQEHIYLLIFLTILLLLEIKKVIKLNYLGPILGSNVNLKFVKLRKW